MANHHACVIERVACGRMLETVYPWAWFWCSRWRAVELFTPILAASRYLQRLSYPAIVRVDAFRASFR